MGSDGRPGCKLRRVLAPALVIGAITFTLLQKGIGSPKLVAARPEGSDRRSKSLNRWTVSARMIFDPSILTKGWNEFASKFAQARNAPTPTSMKAKTFFQRSQKESSLVEHPIRSEASGSGQSPVMRRPGAGESTKKRVARGPPQLSRELKQSSNIRRGRLPNGLRYTVLPNKIPKGKFEAHLEMHVGSVEEEEGEQGVAHIVEHVTFLGSKARSNLYAAGVDSNAYTDFHHTVYHLSSPTEIPEDVLKDVAQNFDHDSSILSQKYKLPNVRIPQVINMGEEMVPLALDALREIAFDAELDEKRIDKERRAILSEIGMMATLDYRMTAREIEELHKENILPKRLPLGDKDVVKNIPYSKIRSFYDHYYHPPRTSVFLVGDFDAERAERAIVRTFASIPSNRTEAKKQFEKIFGSLTDSLKIPPVKGGNHGNALHLPKLGKKSEIEAETTTQDIPEWKVREPIEHLWSESGRSKSDNADTPDLPSVFLHPLLTGFQIIMCAKSPTSRLRTLGDLREFIITRLAVSGIAHKLGSSEDGNRAYVEFDHSDSASEGCCVTTVKLVSEPTRWKENLESLMEKIHRSCESGLNLGEFLCIKEAFIKDAQLAGIQGEDVPSSEMIQGLIDAELLNHTFITNHDYSELAQELSPTISLREVNERFRSLLEYVHRYGLPDAPVPSAVLLCSPAEDGSDLESNPSIPETQVINIEPKTTNYHGTLENKSNKISVFLAEEAQKIIQKSVYASEEMPKKLSQNSEEVPRPPPKNLIPSEYLDSLKRGSRGAPPPKWLDEGIYRPAGDYYDNTLGISRKHLSNGIRINFKKSQNHKKQFILRASAPGGISLEGQNSIKPGAIRTGVYAVTQGGSTEQWSRAQLDMYSLRNLLNVSFAALPETMRWEIGAPSSSSREAVEMLRVLLTDLKLDEKDIDSAKQLMIAGYHATQRSLEMAPNDLLSRALTSDDPRFREPTPEEIESLTLTDVRSAIEATMCIPEGLEISVVGDFEQSNFEELIRVYLGSIPTLKTEVVDSSTSIFTGGEIKPDPFRRTQVVQLEDSQSRAVGYISGFAPNRWGYSVKKPQGFDENTGIWLGGAYGDAIERGGAGMEVGYPGGDDTYPGLRAHPAYVPAALAVLERMLNNLLFLTIRDSLSLTYHVKLEIGKAERSLVNTWKVTVHAQPEDVHQAVEACSNVLRKFRVSEDMLEDAKRAILNRQESEKGTDHFWLSQIEGLQSDTLPRKDLRAICDFDDVVRELTCEDVHDVYAALDFRQETPFTCIAIARTQDSEDEIVQNTTEEI